MSNRFELEQDILGFGTILDEIRILVYQNAPSTAYVNLAELYEYKFNKLWGTFEDMVYNKEFAQDDSTALS